MLRNYMKIHILGASGSGTTTLGVALSKKLNIAHFDSDYYFWEPTHPPFKEVRDKTQRTELLWNDLVKCESWVLSGSATGWGDFILDLVDYVIFIRGFPKYMFYGSSISIFQKQDHH